MDRVYEVSLADLDNDSDDKAYRKFRLVCEEVQGKDVLLNFHGMTFTADKLRGLVKKWHSLIECITEVKTSDGYTLRVFIIGFTKKSRDQIKKTSYAQTSQVCTPLLPFSSCMFRFEFYRDIVMCNAPQLHQFVVSFCLSVLMSSLFFLETLDPQQDRRHCQPRDWLQRLEDCCRQAQD
jgi:hypothetical protein